MKTIVELNKQQKKLQKEFHKQQRVEFGFNLGTRDMKSEKDYSRKANKIDVKEYN